MNSWLIIPRDPLIFRDGKPFTGTPGERAKSLTFPFPATLAGAVRTRSGTHPQNGFDAGRIGDLLDKTIQGPFLVELGEDGSIATRYVPAPADALLVETAEKDMVQRHALTPIKMPEDAHVDLTSLSIVGHVPHIKEKPYHKSPRYWNWGAMQTWLIEATDSKEPINPKTIGLEELPREHRTHVSIEPGTQVAREGALFQTSGMEFIRAGTEQLKDMRTLALALATDADLEDGVDSLGGERRIVEWQKTQQAIPEATCPDPIKKKVVDQKRCRLILATSAYFRAGYLPDATEWKKKHGVEVSAVALSRYQTISGWDYKEKSPKLTRRLVPAGSVYFLTFDDKATNKQIEDFIEAVWLRPISDDVPSQRDGFGLALIGTWENQNAEVMP